MPIAEIINEIDAYLSRLHQARELLLDRRTKAPQKRIPGRKRKVILRQADPASSNGRRANENKPRSKSSLAHPNRMKSADTGAQVSSSMPHRASHSEQRAIEQPERTAQKSVVITKLPARRRIGSIKSVRRRTAGPALETERNKIKPAIALAGPIDSKIVVVSAEQLQREREQAARPAVRRPRTPASGLSGQLAFEALFRN